MVGPAADMHRGLCGRDRGIRTLAVWQRPAHRCRVFSLCDRNGCGDGARAGLSRRALSDVHPRVGDRIRSSGQSRRRVCRHLSAADRARAFGREDRRHRRVRAFTRGPIDLDTVGAGNERQSNRMKASPRVECRGVRSIILSILAMFALLAQSPQPSPAPSTVSSDTSLVGWAAGPAVTAELDAEKTMMRVPGSANAMEIERHLSSVPHRAGSAADHATALYVAQRLERDGFTTRIKEYEVMFTGPLEQSLTLLSPRHVQFDMLEGAPGRHTKWELMAGPPFLEESGDGAATGPAVYVNTASKDDLAEIDAQHVSLKGAVAIVRLSAPGGGGIRNIDPSWIAYNELRKRGVAAILEFMEPGTTGYGGGVTWPGGNYKNVNMAERMGGMSPRGFMMFPPGDPTSAGKAPIPGAPHKTWDEIPH